MCTNKDSEDQNAEIIYILSQSLEIETESKIILG